MDVDASLIQQCVLYHVLLLDRIPAGLCYNVCIQDWLRMSTSDLGFLAVIRQNSKVLLVFVFSLCIQAFPEDLLLLLQTIKCLGSSSVKETSKLAFSMLKLTFLRSKRRQHKTWSWKDCETLLNETGKLWYSMKGDNVRWSCTRGPQKVTYISESMDVVTRSTNHAMICPKVPNAQTWWLGLRNTLLDGLFMPGIVEVESGSNVKTRPMNTDEPARGL